jgi:hypothetical protein
VTPPGAGGSGSGDVRLLGSGSALLCRRAESGVAAGPGNGLAEVAAVEEEGGWVVRVVGAGEKGVGGHERGQSVRSLVCERASAVVCERTA